VSIDLSEFNRIRDVALLLRTYAQDNNLLAEDVALLMNLISKFRQAGLTQFIDKLLSLRDFVQANNITRNELVKAFELLQLVRR